jgi:hypothetical protein
MPASESVHPSSWKPSPQGKVSGTSADESNLTRSLLEALLALAGIAAAGMTGGKMRSAA